MFAVSKQIHAGGKELQDRAEFFWCGSNLVLVVADGAGGMSGGAEAAEFVVEGVKQRIDSVTINRRGLEGFLIVLDREMAAKGSFGETTCVLVVLSDDGVIGASVGDSGAFIFSKNGTENLTAGQICKPFLGSGRATPVGFSRRLLYGTLLVGSDGLLKYASLETIAATALGADLDAAAKKLVDLVRYQSGGLPDDVSILLAREI
jgi:serine/threonine protein phosphatase PrpC